VRIGCDLAWADQVCIDSILEEGSTENHRALPDRSSRWLPVAAGVKGAVALLWVNEPRLTSAATCGMMYRVVVCRSEELTMGRSGGDLP